MNEEPPVCARCGEEYTIEYGDEPTKYCHSCAHIVLEGLEQEFETALDRIADLVWGEGCRFSSRFSFRPKGETCTEYKTWEQGVPHPGCDLCQGREFLEKHGRESKKYYRR